MLSAYKIINHNIGLVTLKCWIKSKGVQHFVLLKLTLASI